MGRRVAYSLGVSLDGYIVGPDGDFGWTEPDEEVFRFVTDEIREIGVQLMGRRLYETMLYWETADQDPSLDDAMLEWAAIWKALPKVVFSTTLSAVRGRTRLASGGLAEEIERLRAEPGRGTSPSAAGCSPPRRPRWASSTSTGPGSTPCWLAVASRSFPSAGAGWISSSLSTAPSDRESSTSATA